MEIKIGTRGSRLALIQAEMVKNELLAYDNKLTISITPIKTSGDKIQHKALYDIGGKGLFVKELEEALRNGVIDIAVHSAKDVPGIIPSNTTIAAYLKREDPRDAFLSTLCNNTLDLPLKARVGTSSPRRAVQLLALRPDLQIVPLRGNIDTRLTKLDNKEVDATIMAVAGLKRSGISNNQYNTLEIDEMLPAVAQGAICLQIRSNDKAMNELVLQINHQQTAIEVSTERTLLAAMNAGCDQPIAAYATMQGSEIIARCLLANNMLQPSSIQRFKATLNLAEHLSFGEIIAKQCNFK